MIGHSNSTSASPTIREVSGGRRAAIVGKRLVLVVATRCVGEVQDRGPVDPTVAVSFNLSMALRGEESIDIVRSFIGTAETMRIHEEKNPGFGVSY